MRTIVGPHSGVSYSGLLGRMAFWSTGLAPARLSISATGEEPLVGDAAQLDGVGGLWLGVLTSGDEKTPTGGSITAVAPTAAAPEAE